MKYEIQGETLPVVICQLADGERHDYRGRRHVMDVSEYEDGNNPATAASAKHSGAQSAVRSCSRMSTLQRTVTA